VNGDEIKKLFNLLCNRGSQRESIKTKEMLSERKSFEMFSFGK
jgi:hypothetical protein